MKNRVSFFLVGFMLLIGISSCEKTLKENIEIAISETEKLENLPDLAIQDTVMLADLTSVKAKYDSSLRIFEEQAKQLPQQLADCKSRIADAEEKVKAAPKMLQAFWDNIIADEHKTLEQLQSMIDVVSAQIPFVKEDLKFVESAIANQQDGVAYYVAEATVNGQKNKYYITPAFKLLEKPSKRE